jgi:hypothetical protein
VILAPGARRTACCLTGPLGQIRLTEAVEVDFGQSFNRKKVTSRSPALSNFLAIQFTLGGAGLTACAIR